MKTMGIKKISTCLVVALAAAFVMMVLTACAPKEITVTVIDGEATTEVVTQEGKTVEEILAANDIALEEGDVVEPALDTKIEDEGKEIIIERMKNVVIAVDGKNLDVALLDGTVQDALDQAEVTLASGDKVDLDLITPLEDGMIITVTRAPKAQPKSNSNASSSSQSASKPAGKTVVSRTKVPNCDDGSHGYEEIHYSDGSVEYREY